MEVATALVLVDVDGVLNPRRPSSTEYRRHWVFPGGARQRGLGTVTPRRWALQRPLAGSVDRQYLEVVKAVGQ